VRSPTGTPKLQRLAAQAAHDPARGGTPLAPRIDADLLREASRCTRKASATGLDGVTAPPYAADLDEPLRDLPERLRSGRYQAPPVERVWSEPDDGKQRPLGKPTCEDTIVQRAGALLLAAIEEPAFWDGSYGFRPGRSPHDALHELRERCRTEGLSGIVDADVRGDFDSMDRTRLREGRRQRVKDGRRWRLIGQWLRAGGMEDGALPHPETGVVQGGGISPGFATICLHHGLEAGVERDVRPRRTGRSILLRFADDCAPRRREGVRMT